MRNWKQLFVSGHKCKNPIILIHACIFYYFLHKENVVCMYVYVCVCMCMYVCMCLYICIYAYDIIVHLLVIITNEKKSKIPISTAVNVLK
jgi:hypothetical protein